MLVKRKGEFNSWEKKIVVTNDFSLYASHNLRDF